MEENLPTELGENIAIDNFVSNEVVVDSATQEDEDEDEDSNIKSNQKLKEYLLKISRKS